MFRHVSPFPNRVIYRRHRRFIGPLSSITHKDGEPPFFLF